MTTVGERYVGPFSHTDKLIVKDFNPYLVRRTRKAIESARRERESESKSKSGLGEVREEPSRREQAVDPETVVDNVVMNNPVDLLAEEEDELQEVQDPEEDADLELLWIQEDEDEGGAEGGADAGGADCPSSAPSSRTSFFASVASVDCWSGVDPGLALLTQRGRRATAVGE